MTWSSALVPLLIVGALVALGVLLWRRPWRGARTRYPIVLAHGLMGFEALGVGPLRQEYFRGIVSHLRALGNEVYCPAVPTIGSVRVRAERLAEAVRQIPARRVSIVAHSMGGLDARYAISKLGLANKVGALVTLGTPHYGTLAADVGTLGLSGLLARLGVGALADLTSAASVRFNEDIPKARGVRYACVLAASSATTTCRPLRLTFNFLSERGFANDGLVTVSSQRYGRVLGKVEADHWAQVGWSLRYDVRPCYTAIARWLRAHRL